MIKIERKKSKNKDFYYLTERFNTGSDFKKIQVYIGKNVPKDLEYYYKALKEKELKLIRQYKPKTKAVSKKIEREALIRLEEYALDWKYFISQKTEREKINIFRDFAIHFIFESNSIEGSKLSQDEVSNIVHKRYRKKILPRNEIQEVYNSIDALDFIRSGKFILNQKNIKKVHKTITNNLNYVQGFKKVDITVNNKNTIAPEFVKEEIQSLIFWYKKNKKKGNPFMNAIIFHNRFEYIHPFEDGNGRTGRMLLLWMLFETKYDVLLFKKKNMQKYFRSLDYGDNGRHTKIIIYSIEVYKKTIQEIIKNYK